MKLVSSNTLLPPKEDSTSTMLKPSELSIELALMDVFVSTIEVNKALIALGLMQSERKIVAGRSRTFDFRYGRGMELGEVKVKTKLSRTIVWRSSVVMLLSEYFKSKVAT